MKNFEKYLGDVDFYKDFKKVKGVVLFKLLPLKTAIKMADNSDIAFTTVFDNLAKVYYVPVDCNDFGLDSITVTRTHINDWNTTLEELDSIATNNIAKNDGSAQTMAEILGPMMADLPMVVVSNENKMYGAAQLFNKALLNKALDILNIDKGFILPSSIHECIVIPADLEDTDDLIEMVKYVNATEIKEEDILTNDIFSYERNSEIVRIAA